MTASATPFLVTVRDVGSRRTSATDSAPPCPVAIAAPHRHPGGADLADRQVEHTSPGEITDVRREGQEGRGWVGGSAERSIAVVEEYGYDVGRRTAGDDIGLVVPVEIADIETLGGQAYWIGLPWLERPVSVAPEHRYVGRAGVGGDEVQPAVAGQVGHPHATGDQSVDRVAPGAAEGAVPVAQENGHVARSEVGDLDVAGDQPGRVVDGGGEGSVSVAEQHGDVIRDEVCGDQVDLAVVPEVAGVQRGRQQASRPDLHRRGEGPVPAAHEDGDVVREQVVDEDVRLAVAIDVRHSHPGGGDTKVAKAEQAEGRGPQAGSRREQGSDDHDNSDGSQSRPPSNRLSPESSSAIAGVARVSAHTLTSYACPHRCQEPSVHTVRAEKRAR